MKLTRNLPGEKLLEQPLPFSCSTLPPSVANKALDQVVAESKQLGETAMRQRV